MIKKYIQHRERWYITNNMPKYEMLLYEANCIATVLKKIKELKLEENINNISTPPFYILNNSLNDASTTCSITKRDDKFIIMAEDIDTMLDKLYKNKNSKIKKIKQKFVEAECLKKILCK